LVGFFAFLFGTISMAMLFLGLNVNSPSTQCSTPLNSGPYFSTYWTILMGICTLIIFCLYFGD